MRTRPWKFNKIRGQSRKSNLDSRARFNFTNGNDPNYKKAIGKTYTEKQLKLLSGETPWETTPIQQITVLLQKAEALNDTAAYKKAKELRELKLKQLDNAYVPDISVEEARNILRELTPWKANKQ